MGPTAGDPTALAGYLGQLATHPRLTVHRKALEELAAAVRSGEGLAEWAGADLVAAYAGTGAFAAPAVPGGAPGGPWTWARVRELLRGWSAGLVFLPLLFTWIGLGAAGYAYQRMRAAGQDDGESFLALWQRGFDGHLWGPLHFDLLVIYTVVALLGLVVHTVRQQRRAQRQEDGHRLLAARLAGALVQVQALAGRAAHATPGRFADELQGAAAELRSIVALAASAQKESRQLVLQATRTLDAGRDVADTLGVAATGLRAAVESANDSTVDAGRVAQRLEEGVDALSGAVLDAVRGATQGVQQAVHAAAVQLADATQESVRSMAEAAQESRELHARATREGATALDQAGSELVVSVKELKSTLTELPGALEGAAAEGAEHIGWAYDRAVLALATSLREDVQSAYAAVTGQLGQLADVVSTRVAEEHERLRAVRPPQDGVLQRPPARARPEDAVTAEPDDASPGRPPATLGPPDGPYTVPFHPAVPDPAVPEDAVPEDAVPEDAVPDDAGTKR